MKTFRKSKLFVCMAAAAALSACGGDSSNDDDVIVENSAPTVGTADMTFSYDEADEGVKIIYFIQGSDSVHGDNPVLNEVLDADGDILTVQNMSVTGDGETVGVLRNGIRVEITPSEYVSSLNTGDTHEIVYTFDVSDGTAAVSRTFTVEIVGEDFAPEFDPGFEKTFSKFDPTQTVDLLEGVTDADGDALTVSNVMENGGAPSSYWSVSGSTLTVDIDSFGDSIALGDIESLDFSYTISDGLRQVDRQLIVDVVGSNPTPVSPVVTGAQTVTLTMSNSVNTEVDLVASPAVVDENLDVLSIPADALTPVGNAPALSFVTLGGETEIVIDALIFAPYVASGETETFTYSYTVSDGTSGHDEPAASLEITVVNDGVSNLLTNGSFEDGTTGWTIAGTNSLVTLGGQTNNVPPADGANILRMETDGAFATMDMPDLEAGELYMVEVWQSNSSCFFGSILGVTSGTDYVNGRSSTSNGCGGNGYYSHLFTGGDDLVLSYQAGAPGWSGTPWSDLDDVRVMKVSYDPANNLLSSDDSTFENGVGGWVLPETGAEIIDNGIDGRSLAYTENARGRIELPLGQVIENGKRYLLSFDVQVIGAEALGGLDEFGRWIVDKNDVIDAPAGKYRNTYGNGWDWAGGFIGITKLIPMPNDAAMTYSTVLEIDKVSGATDWADRDVTFLLELNRADAARDVDYIFDNVRLIELPLNADELAD